MSDTPLVKKHSGSTIHSTSSSRRTSHGQKTGRMIDDRDQHRRDVEMEDMGSDDDIVIYDAATPDGDEDALLQDREGHEQRRGSRTLGDDNGEGSASTSERGTAAARHRIHSSNKNSRQTQPTFFRQIIINALLISLWYSFSISISVYNKWMFSKENLNFPYPLFTTSLHMLVQFSLACAVLFFMPRFRPSAAPDIDNGEARYSQLDDSADARSGQPVSANKPQPAGKTPLMSPMFYFTRIAPCGTATALDIGLGNFSLRFISLTFYTMCKSSVLAFVLLFAFLFRLEHPTWRLCAIILLMTAGVVMMVAGEAAFNAAGFALVMSASLCSGFRWSVTQILLLRNRATSNPFSAGFFLTPVMFIALFVLALPVEGPKNVVHGISTLVNSEGGALSVVILLFPGVLAFLMVSAEFALLQRTSVVTLSVCGIFKEVLTISVAAFIFGDELTPINVSGLLVTIVSIAAYNWLKYSKIKRAAAEEAQEILEADAREGALRKSSEHESDGKPFVTAE